MNSISSKDCPRTFCLWLIILTVVRFITILSVWSCLASHKSLSPRGWPGSTPKAFRHKRKEWRLFTSVYRAQYEDR